MVQNNLSPSMDKPLLTAEVAGLEWNHGCEIWSLLKPGKPLRIIREPANEHDPNAVALYFSNTKLGYIPRKSNKPIAQLMDDGTTLEAQICSASISREQIYTLVFTIRKKNVL